MKKVLSEKFFQRPAEEIAEKILGKYLCRNINGKKHSYIITETEAYASSEDLACHASKGKTERTEVMFGPAGYFYVYLVYGMYWMLNIVTDKKDIPSAVLIRGLEDFWGPGIITRDLSIDKSFNGKKASRKNGLWFEDRCLKIDKGNITRASRIGVDYAGPVWSKKPLRFILEKDKM